MILTLSSISSSAQTVRYDWLNLPCAQNLNCNTGCSACNLPDNSGVSFIGTNVVWTGVGVCPHPISNGDNAVYTEGWPIAIDPMIFVGLSAVALEPLQIDSIIIRHRRSSDGPQRLSIQYTNNFAHVPYTLGDVEITQEYQETIFSNVGCIYREEEAPYGGIQIRLQPYQGGAGNWQLDALRIVATPCNASSVGIPENFQRDLQNSTGYVDVLGRPVQGQLAPGVYLGSRKRVQVF